MVSRPHAQVSQYLSLCCMYKVLTFEQDLHGGDEGGCGGEGAGTMTRTAWVATVGVASTVTPKRTLAATALASEVAAPSVAATASLPAASTEVIVATIWAPVLLV